MEYIKSYLISLIVASVICSIVSGFINKESAYGSIIKLMCGIFLLITAVSPLKNFRVDSVTGFWNDLHMNADSIIKNSEAIALSETSSIIKSQSEAYILDKASLMGLEVRVEVTLDDEIPPSPYSVEIKGAVSPYQKKKLEKIILEDLAIPEERQVWT